MEQFLSATISRTGGRTVNQDRSGSEEGRAGIGCWVVADGLGGHPGGEVAAQLAVEAVLETFRTTPMLSAETLQGMFESAHRRLQARQTETPRLARMGTTLVILLAGPGQALWGHLGDSRLYHFRDGCVVLQTKDHSVPQALVNAGDIPPRAIRSHEDRGKLLRALDGRTPRPTLLEARRPVAQGDAFLLCTDGFWDYVTETEMEVELAKAATPAAWLAALERRLLRVAPDEHDNYTAVGVWRGDTDSLTAVGGPPTDRHYPTGPVSAETQ